MKSKFESANNRDGKIAEAGRERFRVTMRRKREVRFEILYQQQRRKLQRFSRQSFFVAGLMLYVAEGDKKNQTRIALANTDPAVIRFFVHWLEVCLGVSKKTIKFQLHLYEDMEVAHEVAFWQRSLGIAAKQIYRPSIRKLRPASFSYPESFRHGTCSLYVLSTNKKAEMMAAVKALFKVIGKV